MENQLILGDCFDILPTLPDKSFNAIITDPPYGINWAKWDKKINLEAFIEQVVRLAQEYYCFFGQMPTVLDWLNAVHSKMKYREHIVWVKRNTSPIYNYLSRCQESIYIYTNGVPQYYKKTGPYSDAKVPGLLFDIITVQGIQRRIAGMERYIKTGENSKSLVKTPQRARSAPFKKTGDMCERVFEKDVNFTNVWSFLPPIYSDGRARKETYLHPTEKPVEAIKRLIELTTPEGGTVLDPFAGSGTTAIACLETGRKYLCIEKEEEYYQVAKKRIEDYLNEPKQLTLEFNQCAD